jgi:hypothetical protein
MLFGSFHKHVYIYGIKTQSSAGFQGEAFGLVA